MWQIWIIIVIILLITSYRYHSYLLFYFFLASIATFIFTLFIHNLLLQTLFFIVCSLIFHLLPHNILPIFLSYPTLQVANSNSLINQTGIVTRSIGTSPFQSGLVQVNQDIWPAVSLLSIEEGKPVKIVSVQGVHLLVTPLSKRTQETTKKDDL